MKLFVQLLNKNKSHKLVQNYNVDEAYYILMI